MGLLFILMFSLALAQQPQCSQKSLWGMAKTNLWNTLGMAVLTEWLPIVAYGTDPKVVRCPEGTYKGLHETCEDLKASTSFQAITIFFKAYGGMNILGGDPDIQCRFDPCPLISTVAQSKHVSFRTIDCRRATMTLECAWYQLPFMILVTIFTMMLATFISIAVILH